MRRLMHQTGEHSKAILDQQYSAVALLTIKGCKMSPRKVYGIQILIGLACIVAGLGVGLKDIGYLFGAKSATGEILSISTSSYRKQGVVHTGGRYINETYATVRFEDSDGKEILFSENISFLGDLFEKGQAVDVLYNEPDSSKAHIKTYYPFLMFPGFLVTVGVVWLLCLLPSYMFAKSRGVIT